MKKYKVTVLPAEGGKRSKVYIVSASTREDAQQLAFALDGGWGPERNASEMLSLAQSYCAAEELYACNF
jgi:hypothetical protein